MEFPNSNRKIGRREFWSIMPLFVSPAWMHARESGPHPPHTWTIEVARFEAEEGVEIPSKFLITLTADVMTHLRNIRSVVVIADGQAVPISDGSLRLTGSVTAFAAGSRALRYMIPAVAGKTRVGARIKVFNKPDGKLLYESEVDGKVLLGPFGGDTMGACNGLAKEVAKKLRRRFF